jgi:hypothetical protein
MAWQIPKWLGKSLNGAANPQMTLQNGKLLKGVAMDATNNHF